MMTKSRELAIIRYYGTVVTRYGYAREWVWIMTHIFDKTLRTFAPQNSYDSVWAWVVAANFVITRHFANPNQL